MAIQNELSSEIAVALLTDKRRTPAERNELKQVIHTIHDTLQALTEPLQKTSDESQLRARRKIERSLKPRNR